MGGVIYSKHLALAVHGVLAERMIPDIHRCRLWFYILEFIKHWCVDHAKTGGEHCDTASAASFISQLLVLTLRLFLPFVYSLKKKGINW